MLNSYRKLAALLNRQERRQAILLFALLLCVAAVEVAGVASVMPFMAVLSNPEAVATNGFLAAVYDSLGFESLNAFTLFLGGAFFCVLVISLTLKAVGYWAQISFSARRNHVLGCRLVAGYLAQPYHWFLNNASARLATTVLSEANQVVTQSLFPAMQILAHGFIAVLLVTLLIVVEPVLAIVVAIAMGGLYWVIFFATRRYLERIGAERRKANRARFQTVQEAFSGIKDVKIAGLEGVYLRRFEAPSERVATRIVQASLLSEIPSFAMQGLLFGAMMLVLLYLTFTQGGFQEALPVLSLYAFAGYRLMPALQGVYKGVSQLRFSAPALDALHRDLSTIRQLSPRARTFDGVQASEKLPLRKALVVSDLRYTYPEAPRPAIDGLSLTIPAKTRVAFVGSTGSGKTTVADIILGLLRPESGIITVDGELLDDINLAAWQRNIGYVPQQVFLIDDTVTRNIAFGVPDENIDFVAVERAAKTANLHEFVADELTDGYATEIGERGVRLSGGQRQRIGIARALYHDPGILILDEATSALDNVTEKIVMEAVDAIGDTKTVILIAHRLSTVQSCDCIFLLENGRVATYGKYEELLEHSREFQALAAGRLAGTRA